jgi:hypothetical protein
MKDTIINGNRIASGTVTSTQIGSATITGSNIASGTIANSNLVNPTINSLAGTTAGTLYYVEPFTLGNYKKVIVNVSGYENDTTTNQSITYPTAFATVAAVTSNTSGLTVSTTITTLTITAPDSTTVYNGVITIEGY